MAKPLGKHLLILNSWRPDSFELACLNHERLILL